MKPRELRRSDAPGSPREQLAHFVARYTPGTAAKARTILRRMRRLVPGAVELVYDNYNALAIGFGPSERASDVIVSIAVYPRWVSLFFLKDGVRLADPHGLLKGSGARVRHIVLEPPELLDSPAVKTLIRHALTRASVRIDPHRRGRIVVKSISARRRPRRPA